jgi:hypothetical protein
VTDGFLSPYIYIISQHWCRSKDSYAFGQEFPAIIPQDVRLKSSLDFSVSQIIRVCIFTAFFSVDLHLIVADIFQDSSFQIQHTCLPSPCIFTTDDCLSSNLCIWTVQPSQQDSVYSQAHLKVISLENVINQNSMSMCKIFPDYTCTHPVLSVNWDDSVAIVTRLQDKWPRIQGSLLRKKKWFFLFSKILGLVVGPPYRLHNGCWGLLLIAFILCCFIKIRNNFPFALPTFCKYI